MTCCPCCPAWFTSLRTSTPMRAGPHPVELSPRSGDGRPLRCPYRSAPRRDPRRGHGERGTAVVRTEREHLASSGAKTIASTRAHRRGRRRHGLLPSRGEGEATAHWRVGGSAGVGTEVTNRVPRVAPTLRREAFAPAAERSIFSGLQWPALARHPPCRTTKTSARTN